MVKIIQSVMVILGSVFHVSLNLTLRLQIMYFNFSNNKKTVQIQNKNIWFSIFHCKYKGHFFLHAKHNRCHSRFFFWIFGNLIIHWQIWEIFYIKRKKASLIITNETVYFFLFFDKVIVIVIVWMPIVKFLFLLQICHLSF